ncbi:MAG: DNA primase, partial [Rhodomicrobium sp.]
MKRQATELAQRLAGSAEAVCRYYLPNGRRQGRYWLVGDVQGSKGQSLYVRLAGEGCGRWTDAATAERGDLLDLIRLNQGHQRLRDTLVEARRFLNEPQPASMNGAGGGSGYHQDNPEAAQRLWRCCKPIAGTLAERYLRHRGITGPLPANSLRFHPRLFYRAYDEAPVET